MSLAPVWKARIKTAIIETQSENMSLVEHIWAEETGVSVCFLYANRRSMARSAAEYLAWVKRSGVCGAVAGVCPACAEGLYAAIRGVW